MSGAVLVLDEAMDAYHGSPCVSNSKLGVLDDGGPALYHGRFVARTIPAPEPTEALILGCAFDTLLTESRAKFAERYVIKPKGLSFATNIGKAWKADHCADGQPLITWDQWEMFEAMEQAVRSDPLFATLIHGEVIPQATVRMATTRYGVGVQSRPDWLSRRSCEFSGGRPYSVNLKTTLDWSDWFNDADPEHPQTGKPVYTHGYHRQAAIDQWVLFNVDEIGETAHFLLVIEKQEPYRVGWVQLTEAYLEAGWREADAGLQRLQHHFATNTWPKTPGGVRSLPPPRWLVDRSIRIGQP